MREISNVAAPCVAGDDLVGPCTWRRSWRAAASNQCGWHATKALFIVLNVKSLRAICFNEENGENRNQKADDDKMAAS